MTSANLILKSSLVLLLFFLLACKKQTNNNTPPGGSGGDLSISSASPEYTFWGDELTINGTGFSTKKTDNFVWVDGISSCGSASKDSNGWKKAEVVSATATQLKIKIPYALLNQPQGDRPCGNDNGVVRITVNGKFAYYGIKMLAIPTVGSFVNTASPNAVRPGIDAIIDASLGYLKIAGYADKIKISAGGTHLSIQEYATQTINGFRFTLPPAQFVQMICSPIDGTYGEPGRQLPFKISVEGTNKESTTNFFVYNLHNNYNANNAGSLTFSKTGSGPNAQFTVAGLNMFFNKAKFIGTGGCGSATIDIPPCIACSELTIVVPLFSLNAGCSYTVQVEDACGRTKSVATVAITP